MPALTLKVGDTFPAWIAILADLNGPIALAGNVSAVKLAGKSSSGLSDQIGPVTTTVATENSLTATTTQGSSQLTVVSSLTGISVGSSLATPNLPPNAIVGSFAGSVINMVAAGSITQANPAGTPVVALTSGVAVAIVANRGMVSYTPTGTDTATADVYDVEFTIHWNAGGVQRVPNKKANNPQIEIDAQLLAGE